MEIRVIDPALDEGTDGLVSAYQRTEITGMRLGAAMATARQVPIGVTVLPSREGTRPSNSPSTPVESVEPVRKPLEAAMSEDVSFYHLTERGLADLKEGRYSKLEDVKRRLGDI